jgi:two-component sensor histidine kinase
MAGSSDEIQTSCCMLLWIGCIFLLPNRRRSRIRFMDRSRPHPRAPWKWITLIWSGVGLFDATQNVFVMRSEGMHHAWAKLFFVLLVSWVPWAMATPLILMLARQFPPVRLRLLSTWPIHLCACGSVGLAHSGWNAVLDKTLNPWIVPSLPAFLPLWRDKFLNGLLSSVVLYAAIVAVAYVAESRERLARQSTETARLNEELSKAQLTALRRQIEPHFLFNTLNAVAGLVREKRNDDAVHMIAALSDFLRWTVKESNLQQVPLAEEMDFLQKYLDIQKVRFAERLRLRVNVPAEFLPAQVPSLLLQPLVENAIKHGIAKRSDGGEIEIAARRSNGTLSLVVSNDGPPLAADWRDQSGIGISNIRTRLQGLYGSNFTFDVRDRKAGGVQVSISLPFVSGKIQE